jgi:transcriptional regulator with XRE-family HTH domain
MKRKLREANKDVLIGEILRQQRLLLSLSQRDIALKLGYRNINFISMIEHGNSRLPFGKLPEIVKAYQLDQFFLPIIVRALYPEAWGVFLQIIYEISSGMRINNRNIEVILIGNQHVNIEDALDEVLIKAIKDFRIRLE